MGRPKMGWSRHPLCYIMGIVSAGVSFYKPLVLGEAPNLRFSTQVGKDRL